MKWLNVNHIEGEMSDADFQLKIRQEAKTRDQKQYGRDGNFEVYAEQFSYKGIPYLIKILRYYQIGVPLNQIKGMNSLGKWAVLEYPAKFKKFANFLEGIGRLTGLYEFLWADTLHCGQERWTLEQMVSEMHRHARADIDMLPKIRQNLGEKFRDLNKQLTLLYPKRRGRNRD